MIRSVRRQDIGDEENGTSDEDEVLGGSGGAGGGNGLLDGVLMKNSLNY